MALSEQQKTALRLAQSKHVIESVLSMVNEAIKRGTPRELPKCMAILKHEAECLDKFITKHYSSHETLQRALKDVLFDGDSLTFHEGEPPTP